jgi:hypothetical protein
VLAVIGGCINLKLELEPVQAVLVYITIQFFCCSFQAQCIISILPRLLALVGCTSVPEAHQVEDDDLADMTNIPLEKRLVSEP